MPSQNTSNTSTHNMFSWGTYAMFATTCTYQTGYLFEHKYLQIQLYLISSYNSQRENPPYFFFTYSLPSLSPLFHFFRREAKPILSELPPPNPSCKYMQFPSSYSPYIFLCNEKIKKHLINLYNNSPPIYQLPLLLPTNTHTLLFLFIFSISSVYFFLLFLEQSQNLLWTQSIKCNVLVYSHADKYAIINGKKSCLKTQKI